RLDRGRRAFLRWWVNGGSDGQRAGLAPPAIVQDATAAYFADQDTLQQWLEECTEDGGPAAFTRSAELFASWKQWCEERNWQPGSAMALSEALADRGFEKGPGGQRELSGLQADSSHATIPRIHPPSMATAQRHHRPPREAHQPA